ncbi:hypothetical protein RWV98_18965 [Agathobaculum sp. NTUH-O15-33]|uniref:hypothetical protein n=1 Tax=Agathobaculum sp. NTUH-O15-33 TaxID=3079302 RepID=UPI0029588DF7|nr:hypothetical protein [Agathobaculum sp. NTUH-O15-33]WNX84628.1 hypothetical protein RWV98_18965 [Agathobaculum sp. NTUH-O15-33]
MRMSKNEFFDILRSKQSPISIENSGSDARPLGTLRRRFVQPIGLYPFSAAVRRLNESKPSYMLPVFGQIEAKLQFSISALAVAYLQSKYGKNRPQCGWDSSLNKKGLPN